MSALPQQPRRDRSAVLCLFAAVVVANAVFRDLDWRFEWRWALFQAGFVNVLLGPLVAGTAGIVGVQFARRRRLVARTSGSERRAVLLDLWSVVRPAWAVHAGAVAVTGAIVATSSHQWPSANALLALPGPFLQLLAAAVVGWAVGEVIGRWWAAALVAAGWFGGTLILYVRGTMVLVRTGGATSSLVGLEISTVYVLRQWLWLVVVAVGATAVGVDAVRAGRTRWFVVAPVALIIVVVGAVLASASSHREPFDRRATPVVCGSEPIPICLAPEYESFRPEVTSSLERALAWWRSIGGTDTPDRAVQREMPSSARVLTVSPRATSPADVVWQLLLMVGARQGCPETDLFTEADRARSRLGELARFDMSNGRVVFSQDIAEATPAERRAMATDALATIRAACPGPG